MRVVVTALDTNRSRPRPKLGQEVRLMTTQSQWLTVQEGSVVQFEKVPHTYLNEDTGEMRCEKCGESEMTRPNSSRRLTTHWNQTEAFERFTAQHVHGISVA
jgi:hypothetical protein